MTEQSKKEFFKSNDSQVVNRLTELLKRKPCIDDYAHVEVVVKKNREVIIKYKNETI